MLQSTAAASERVFEFLDEKKKISFAENPVSVEGLQGNVEFEHVHFGYNPEHIIINDFSAKVKEGQEDRHRRTDWSRKDNHDQTADAFL